MQGYLAELLVLECSQVPLAVSIDVDFVLKDGDHLHAIVGEGQDGDQKVEEENVREVDMQYLKDRELHLELAHA